MRPGITSGTATQRLKELRCPCWVALPRVAHETPSAQMATCVENHCQEAPADKCSRCSSCMGVGFPAASHQNYIHASGAHQLPPQAAGGGMQQGS
jgi:hypothetical protein